MLNKNAISLYHKLDIMKKLLRKIVGNNTIDRIKSLLHEKEEKKLNEKRRKFYLQFLQSKNDIYFDAGANHGNRILPIINEGFKIIAIEPQKNCIKILKKKFGDQITIVPKGLAEKEETKTMYISNVDTITSFSKDFIEATQESGRFSEYNWDKEEKIEMTTLDHLIKTYGKPKFIKIDVEGFEYEVLKGLSQPIDYISFEYTIPERRQAILDCINKIEENSSSKKLFFNYSVGETMEWAMSNWLLPEEMRKEIDSERFIQSGFGDVYSKTEL